MVCEMVLFAKEGDLVMGYLEGKRKRAPSCVVMGIRGNWLLLSEDVVRKLRSRKRPSSSAAKKAPKFFSKSETQCEIEANAQQQTREL